MVLNAVITGLLASMALAVSGSPVAATTLSSSLDSRAGHGGGPAAKARFNLSADGATGRLCYRLDLQDTDHRTVARLRRFTKAKAGTAVLDLRIGVNSCAAPGEAVVREIITNPAAFYIDVLNTGYPEAAMRGQLAMAD